MTHVTTQAGPAVSAGPAPGRRRKPGMRSWATIAGFAGPALLVYAGFVLLPVSLAAVYSFFKWNGLAPLTDFVGIDNYARALGDPVFLNAIGNNLFFVFFSMVIQGPLAIAVALLLNRRFRGRSIARVVIFAPYIVSEVIAALCWRLILQPHGPFDSLLAAVGLSELRQLWLADMSLVMWTLFGIATWKYLGFAIILFLAGLQGVPDELSEAAAIDGANWWQIQRHITLPLLAPTIRIWAFLSIVGCLQLFDLVRVTTNGGPANASATMATYMVTYGFERSQFGYGSAVAVILFVISLVFALLYQRFVLRRDLDGALTSGVR